MKFVFGLLRGLAAAVAGLLLILLFSAAWLWHAPALCFIPLVPPGVWWFTRGRASGPIFKSAMVLLVLFSVPALSLRAVTEVQNKVAALALQLQANGPTGFSFTDKAGVYLLGLAYAAGAAWEYPEAAQERFYLMSPGPKRRRWNSDFPLRSPRVTEVLRSFAAGLGPIEADALASAMLSRQIDFDLQADPLREALALNPLRLDAHAFALNGHWQIDCRGTVEVGYPKQGRIRLLRIGLGGFSARELWMDEGLFRMLQENHWLHPYAAEWMWHLGADDIHLR